MMNRTLVIGDIHGARRALQEVMEKAGVTSSDTLIFLGDYVDGWSESAPLLDDLLALQETHSCIFIKGNHDLWCEEWLRSGEADAVWVAHGGRQTMESYKNYSAAQKSIHLSFLERMPFYHIDVKNRLFIHAGFTSMHGPQQEFHRSNFSWDRTLWEMALTMDRRIQKDSVLYPKRLKLFHEIYIGHTPTLYYNQDQPMQGCNVWNIDTGAAFTGPLSILDVDTKQFWQSRPALQWYPGEMGRNRF